MVCILPDIIQGNQSVTVFSGRNINPCLLPRNLAVSNGTETPRILWCVLLKNLIENGLVWSNFLGCYSFCEFTLLVQASYLNDDRPIFPSLKFRCE